MRQHDFDIKIMNAQILAKQEGFSAKDFERKLSRAFHENTKMNYLQASAFAYQEACKYAEELVKQTFATFSTPN